MASTNPLNTINVGGVIQKVSDYEAAQNQAKAGKKDNSALGKDAFLLAQFSALEQMTNVSKGLENVSKIVDNIDSSVLIGQLSSMIGQPIQWMSETKGEDGAVSKTSFEGKVIGVSITDGAPSIIADVNGQSHKVQISEVVRVGRLTASAT